MPDPNVGFERPPVRQVSLTVYFKPITALQVSHLSAFRERLRELYPDSTERPPLSPEFAEPEETQVIPLTVYNWLFPYLSLANSITGDGLSLQNDRLIRSWKFAGDGSYPGFDVLASDLREKLELLSAEVKEHTGAVPELMAAECHYLNSIETVGTAEELAVGLLTNWGSAHAARLNAPYLGLRIHLHRGDEAGGECLVTIGVDGNIEETPELSITSTRRLRQGEELELGGLHIAHDQLIQAFMEFTSAEMRRYWGETR